MKYLLLIFICLPPPPGARAECRPLPAMRVASEGACRRVAAHLLLTRRLGAGRTAILSCTPDDGRAGGRDFNGS